jgi:hypothetical protein
MAGPCACFEQPGNRLTLVKWLGMDERYAEASIFACPDCGQHWLKVHYELEAFAASGRWYLGAITTEQAEILTTGEAIAALQALKWYFYGGSYYGGRVSKTSGAVVL